MALISGSILVDSAILIGVLIFVLYKYLTRNFDYWKKRNIPFIPPKFFYGSLENVIKLRTTLIDECANLYLSVKAPFFGIFIVDRPVLIIKDLSLIKNITVKDFNYFVDRSAYCDPSSDPVVAHVLFLCPEPTWKLLRSKMRSFFTPAKLKNTTKLINEVQDSMKTYLDDNHHLPNIDAKKLGLSFMVDVIATSAFGIKADSFLDENAEFKTHAKAVFNFTLRNAFAQCLTFLVPQYVKLFRSKVLCRSEDDYFRSCFLNVIATRKETKIERNDLIDAIIKIEEDGDKMSNDQLVAQAVMFLLAGFETSSTTLAFLLYELCLRPDIQEKLREEIIRTKREGELTFEVIHSMKYLQMCVAETLRKYPILPFLDRKCKKDYRIPDTDTVIEKDINVLIPIKGLHFDPQYFPDPEKFDPERFSEENIKNIVPFSYLPFGEGPRNCLGGRLAHAAIKMATITILSDFRVARTDKTPVPVIAEPKTITYASKVGLPMKFEKIHS